MPKNSHELPLWSLANLSKESCCLSVIDNLAYTATIVLSVTEKIFFVLNLALFLILDRLCLQVELLCLARFYYICNLDDSLRILVTNWSMKINFLGLSVYYDIASTVFLTWYSPGMIVSLWSESHSQYCCFRLTGQTGLQLLHFFSIADLFLIKNNIKKIESHSPL